MEFDARNEAGHEERRLCVVETWRFCLLALDGSRPFGGQCERERRALAASLALDPDATAVRFDEPFTDVEPQPGAALLHLRPVVHLAERPEEPRDLIAG